MPGTVEDKLASVEETPNPPEEKERKPEPKEGEDISRFYPTITDSGESIYFQLYPYGLLY